MYLYNCSDVKRKEKRAVTRRLSNWPRSRRPTPGPTRNAVVVVRPEMTSGQAPQGREGGSLVVEPIDERIDPVIATATKHAPEARVRAADAGGAALATVCRGLAYNGRAERGRGSRPGREGSSGEVRRARARRRRDLRMVERSRAREKRSRADRNRSRADRNRSRGGSSRSRGGSSRSRGAWPRAEGRWPARTRVSPVAPRRPDTASRLVITVTSPRPSGGRTKEN
jgi:hypothetical protein